MIKKNYTVVLLNFNKYTERNTEYVVKTTRRDEVPFVKWLLFRTRFWLSGATPRPPFVSDGQRVWDLITINTILIVYRILIKLHLKRTKRKERWDRHKDDTRLHLYSLSVTGVEVRIHLPKINFVKEDYWQILINPKQ